MLGVLLIYLHSPLSAAHPWDCAYISVKPPTAVLQPINVHTGTYDNLCDRFIAQWNG